jgi:hypothetical protein
VDFDCNNFTIARVDFKEREVRVHLKLRDPAAFSTARIPEVLTRINSKQFYINESAASIGRCSGPVSGLMQLRRHLKQADRGGCVQEPRVPDLHADAGRQDGSTVWVSVLDP